MAKRPGGVLIPNLEADSRAGLPLHAQVYRRLRQAILDGVLAPGARLPSTRTLAADLSVSRTTAEEAFAQLDAEGYLVRKVGDGSYVADVRAEQPAVPARARPIRGRSARALSARGLEMARTPACEEPSVPRAFRGGLPALDEFPFELWQRPGRCLYARVDGIARADALLLMELELIEPVLFLGEHPQAPARFAQAIVAAGDPARRSSGSAGALGA